MALWKKTSSGQGDPQGPLGKYITMYNKAVKTLGTDNPEVLKRFFAIQNYNQNKTFLKADTRDQGLRNQSTKQANELYLKSKLPDSDINSDNYSGNPNLAFATNPYATSETKKWQEEAFNNETRNAFMNVPLTMGIDKGIKLAMPIIKSGIKETEKVISNTYKINPWRFKPDPNAYYRALGNNGLNDALETGVLRAHQNPLPNITEGGINLTKRFKYPYFAKGTHFKSLEGYNPKHITEVKNIEFAKGSGGNWGSTPVERINGEFKRLSEIPIDDNVKLYKKHWLKGYKEVPKSITDNTKLSINADGINKNRTWKKGYKEIDGHEDIVPVVNDGEYTPVQDIFIEEHNKYMNSPLFEQKMKEFYPEVNIEQYKKAINHNLKREKLTYKSASEYPSENKNVGGWYVPRENIPNGSFIMPGAKISFKQRINLANEEISKPAYNYQENAGKSFSTSLGKTIEHELGHQRTNANWLLPDDLTQDYLIQNVKKDLTVDELTSGSRNLTNYYSDPTEFDTRILNLKNSLRENGIVDFHKEPITKEHIDKLFSYKSNKEANELQKLVLNNEKYKKGFDLTTEEGRALKKEYDEIWDKIHMLNKKENPYSTSSDIHNLKYYWNSDFLAKMANKLPSLSGISATGIGLSSIKWKNK